MGAGDARVHDVPAVALVRLRSVVAVIGNTVQNAGTTLPQTPSVQDAGRDGSTSCSRRRGPARGHLHDPAAAAQFGVERFVVSRR
ncbi:hypothetical protein ACFYT4_34525 [Streptomyces sp. NPDC004609]|uniref:hypothetical protein n=1 Tax=Streptomyces sp. NPDC004609 TaxID=3364704 RepID=UPI00369AB034